MRQPEVRACCLLPASAAICNRDMSFHEIRFPPTSRRGAGRAGAAHRCGDAWLRLRGAQQPLGGSGGGATTQATA